MSLSFEKIFLKTKIGQHNYGKESCFKKCKIGKQFCPYYVNKISKEIKVKRWTDYMDYKLNNAIGNPSSTLGQHTAFDPNDTERKSFSDTSSTQFKIQTGWCRASCWGDLSGFQHDILATNVVGPGGSQEDIYDIYPYNINHTTLKYSEWNAWIDKYQYDYRFGRVSDLNAECILFPNVDNPWMFTEYVFKGIGDDGKDKCALNIPKQYVIQPPIYDPQTLNLINYDMKIDAPSSMYDKKYANEQKYQYTGLNGQNLNILRKVRKFRQVTSWNDLSTFTKAQVNNNDTLYKEYNKSYDGVVTDDVGVKLYRAKIPVQSVKWGQHGNVPPHAIDMTAPVDWLNPNASVDKIVAVYDAVVGSPFYANMEGVITWGLPTQYDLAANQKKDIVAYINGVSLTESFDSNNKKRYSYSFTAGEGTAMDMPKNDNGKILEPSSKLMGDTGQDNYCHNGCSLCRGVISSNSSGRLICSYLQNLAKEKDEQIENMNNFFNTTYCFSPKQYGGGSIDQKKKCPHYVASQDYPIICTYQVDVPSAVSQTSTNYGADLTLAAIGGVNGALIAASNTANSVYSQIDSLYTNLRNSNKDITITYKVRYEVVSDTDNSIQVNKSKWNQYAQGVQIIAGTGRTALDTQDLHNTIGGIKADTNIYNDISTLSFPRFFRSVMHCATQKNCNDVLGQNHVIGYSVGNRAGGDDDCYYFKSTQSGTIGCPYNGVPKRAVQFGNTASLVGTWINSLIKSLTELCKQYYFFNFYPKQYYLDTKKLYRKVKVIGYSQKILTLEEELQKQNQEEGSVWWIFQDWAIKLNKEIDNLNSYFDEEGKTIESSLIKEPIIAVVAVRYHADDTLPSSSSSSSSSSQENQDDEQENEDDGDKFGFLSDKITEHIIDSDYGGAVLLGQESTSQSEEEVEGGGEGGEEEDQLDHRFCTKDVPNGYMVFCMFRLYPHKNKFYIPDIYCLIDQNSQVSEQNLLLRKKFYRQVSNPNYDSSDQNSSEYLYEEIQNIYDQPLPFYDNKGNELILYDKNCRPLSSLQKQVITFSVLESFYWYHPEDNDGNSLLFNESFYKNKIKLAKDNREKTQIQDFDETYFNYQAKELYNGYGEAEQQQDSDRTMMGNLIQLVDKNGFWFCKYDDNHVIPASNCVIIDNQEKFIGGYHPQYKDYSKIGSEFMQQIQDDSQDRQGTGTGDYGNGVYTGIPTQINKKGYWIEQSGEYILDERDIGFADPIAGGYEQRQSQSGDGSVCISYKRSNTTVDGETGKTVSAKVINGAVFSNDPYDLVYVQFRKRYRDPESPSYLTGGLPQVREKNKDETYYAACYIKNEGQLLPTRRMAMYCPYCDYYIPIKYYGAVNCPWCGSKLKIIKGSLGEEFQSYGSPDQNSGANCGAVGKSWKDLVDDVKDISVIKKFFKIYGFGNVDVWAPPGTAVKTDAYFWRHQSMITNALKKQIYHRLGDRGINVYQFNKDTRISQSTMGYPESIGKFIKITKNEDATGNNINLRFNKAYISWDTDEDVKNESLYNPLMPRHMIPELYDKAEQEDEDQGVIAPYTTSRNDALKIVSYQQMRALRNSIEPMYAYVSDSNDGGDYPVLRASYSNRQEKSQPIIYQGRRSLISPIVLACTDDAVDSYQQYYSGDMTYGQVKEYFPSGYTWWFAKQLLGGRYTAKTQGQYHMDSGSGIMTGGSGGVYTNGNKTLAKCAMFVYGMIPLDKQIAAAYVIISPDGTDASKNPIGLSWSGGPAMYHHYHAKLANHKPSDQDRINYKTDAPAGSWEHLHGTAGYKDKYFDQNGDAKTLTDSTRMTYTTTDEDGNTVTKQATNYTSNDIIYNDESEYRLWGYDSHRLQDDRDIYYENKFSEMMTNLPGIYDFAFYRQVGANKIDVKDINDTQVIGKGYNASCFSTPLGFYTYNLQMTSSKDEQRFQYIVVNDDNDLVLKYPESMIWKKKTAAEIQKIIQNNTYELQFKASDGTTQNSVSYKFTQTDSEVYKNLVPSESQGISDYFDMSWTNTRGNVYKSYSVQKNNSTEWTSPVIFQDSGETGGSYYSGGVIQSNQIGTVTRAFDVTSIIKNMYQSRIEREFKCKAGATLAEIKSFKFYNILKKGSLTSLDDDVMYQNTQFFDSDNNGYSLIDGCSYPLLESTDSIPQIDSSGDKYELCKNQVSFRVYSIGPFKFDENYNAYKVAIDDESTTIDIKYLEEQEEQEEQEGFPNGYTGLKKAVKKIFGEAKDFKTEKISNQQILVTCSSIIIIQDTSNLSDSISKIIHLPVGKYYPIQSRVIQVSDYEAGYNPANFMLNSLGQKNSTNGWRFLSYQLKQQCFVIDLLRAPLCKWERDYRNTKSSIDYSNVKCPNLGCQAHTMGCSVAANMSGKYFTSNSGNCPICGTKLNATQAHVTAGDGIKTYSYDTDFSPNPIISKIVIKGNLTYPSSFRVFIKSNDKDSWRTIIDTDYDSNENKRRILYPSEYSDNASTFTFTDNSVMGRFLKIQCDPYNNLFEHIYRIIEVSNYQIIVEDDFSTLKRFSFADCTATINGKTYTVISAQLVGTQKTKMRITLNKLISSDVIGSNISIKAYQYVGGIANLEVYGYHYKTEEGQNVQSQQKVGDTNINTGKMFLTMTQAQDEYITMLSTRQSKYSLPQAPSQILSVSVGKSGAGGIVLTQAQSSSTNLLWQTEQVALKSAGVVITRITGGNYYYDYNSGRICLPIKDGSGKHWSEFQNNLQKTKISLTYLPNTLSVRYWGGNGKSITLSAQAAGHGPSYMVQKNAIQSIITDLNSMAPNGKSCNMIGVDGVVTQIASIPWICYNNKPARLSTQSQSKSYTSYSAVAGYTAGEFRKPSFNGDEIKKSMDDDSVFKKLFGDHCQGCYGICTTEVTFWGAPNKILSGVIKVKALATTKHNIKLDSTNTIIYEQKTGGLDNGVLIVSCSPSNSSGRATLCFGIPKLLIYVRQANHYPTT